MTQSVVAFSSERDSASTGRHLGETIKSELNGERPDAVVLFASARHDYGELLQNLVDACGPKTLVGCSSAGEFVSDQRGELAASAIALRSDEISFSAGLGRGLQTDMDSVADQIYGGFSKSSHDSSVYHTALILTDAMAGRGDDLIERLNVLTGGIYQFVGGGAGDDANFTKTQVFCGTEVATDAAVGMEMLSTKPVGLGVRHGWSPASKPFRVTASDGARLISLNAAPAADMFEQHARETGQTFDRSSPLSFFLHNVIGIDTGSGHKLRVPLSIEADGSINCAADIPEGVVVHIMRAGDVSAPEAARLATKEALDQLNGHQPEVTLFFDCVATRLRLGDQFDLELASLQESLGSAKFAGCNTYGQIARSEGQFSGFHNCTAVVCVIPQ